MNRKQLTTRLGQMRALRKRLKSARDNALVASRLCEADRRGREVATLDAVILEVEVERYTRFGR